MYHLRLYITGNTSRSQRSIEDLKGVLEPDYEGQYSLEIIDVREDPRLAEKDGVLVTPTVVKSSPPPQRKIIGDLAVKEKVLTILGMRAPPSYPHLDET